MPQPERATNSGVRNKNAAVEFKLCCGRHSRWMNFHSMANKFNELLGRVPRARDWAATRAAAARACLSCRACGGAHGIPSWAGGKGASEHEIRCYQMMQEHFPHLQFTCEYPLHVRPGMCRLVDVFVPSRRLAIQVDGEQHFFTVERRKPGTSCEAVLCRQRKSDESFNNAVCASDGSVVRACVRLDYAASTLLWRQAMDRALELLRGGAEPFVLEA